MMLTLFHITISQTTQIARAENVTGFWMDQLYGGALSSRMLLREIIPYWERLFIQTYSQVPPLSDANIAASSTVREARKKCGFVMFAPSTTILHWTNESQLGDTVFC